MNNVFSLIDRLYVEHSLSLNAYKELILSVSSEAIAYASEKATAVRKAVYGNEVYIRGLIEIGNICKNDCLYCGIRRSNKQCDRFRLKKDDILDCCNTGYHLGFRTFVMQGGEDATHFTDDLLCEIIHDIKRKYPDCAVTLSLGERSYESYKKLYDAGADRYLLRHETADKQHYEKLHPSFMSFDNRMKCLKELKNIGFQTGCGFMVGSPFQTADSLAMDLKFIEEFQPEMCGIGPFIPHRDTPFKDYESGTLEMTLYLLSIIRLIRPKILLPATTALGTIDKKGRERGILAGANVIMPNLSPKATRKKYELYNDKLCTDEEAAEGLSELKQSMLNIGYHIVVSRGDAL